MFNPFKIFSLSEDSEWEVLSKRSSPRMSYADYAYMIKLLARSPWLYHYYPQLEDTVIKLAKTLEERKLLQKLFRKFRWVSNKENGKLIGKIVHKIRENWNCTQKDTMIISTSYKEDNEPDGSLVLIYDIMNQLCQWEDNNFVKSFSRDEIPSYNVKKIILCDDFIGSGGTIEKRVKFIKQVLPNVEIFVVSIACMKSALKRINKVCPYVYAPIILDPSIDVHDTSSSDYITMVGMESKLHSKWKKYNLEQCSMGWGKAGATYKHEKYRIPNNCFPIFWWGKLVNGSDLNSIFLRP